MVAFYERNRPGIISVCWYLKYLFRCVLYFYVARSGSVRDHIIGSLVYSNTFHSFFIEIRTSGAKVLILTPQTSYKNHSIYTYIHIFCILSFKTNLYSFLFNGKNLLYVGIQ